MLTKFVRYYAFYIPLMMFSSPGEAQVDIINAFPHLSFNRPVDLTHAPGDSATLYVVEQSGVIYAFDKKNPSAEKRLFLDIRDRVDDSGNEEGLLGLAFHPEFQKNRYFYVDYTADNPARTVIARYIVDSANPDVAVPNSETVILEEPQPFSNHNAGQILFGQDGYLYITFGDGGSGGDPQGHGQNRFTLLGSIARIDVDNTQGDLNYAIPGDNPFFDMDVEFRQEIYAYGLRNPWRLSQDPVTGWLWTGDVGQRGFEEIDIIEKGANCGWNIMEGTSCYNATTCDTTGLTLPVWQYGRSEGQSITGGHVYRGTAVPELVGRYIYADFVTGRIWALRYDGVGEPENELILNTDLNISAFGIDADHELYICAFNGSIYRFHSPSTLHEPDIERPTLFDLKQNYPNPFNATTTLKFSLAQSSHVTLMIHDLMGKTVEILIDQDLPIGEHSTNWNASGYPSGVYYYSLQTGDGLERRKMILLR